MQVHKQQVKVNQSPAHLVLSLHFTPVDSYYKKFNLRLNTCKKLSLSPGYNVQDYGLKQMAIKIYISQYCQFEEDK